MNRTDYINRETNHSEYVRQRIMAFIREYVEKHSYAPSYAEIAHYLGMGNTSVFRHINKLFELGELETDLPDRFSTSRAYRVARKGRNDG